MRPEEQLEKIIAGIRDEPVDAALVEQAAERVWTGLDDHSILRSCEDFQALIPDYRAGKLSEARALLVKDHFRGCVACRKALEPSRAAPLPIRRREFAVNFYRWAIAAGLLVTAGLTAWGLLSRFGASPAASRLAVQSVEGSLYLISDGGSSPLAAGQELPGGAAIRTAKDSGAFVRLSDGSLVELRERSGLSVSAGRKDLTIHLDRGSVIVQAAKRRSGNLYVATRDCTVAVTGTVFSVNSGLKGSRVSVIEGEVRVSQGRERRTLRPGDQYASSPSVTPVPVRDEIAWSRNLDQHLALLREFSALSKQIGDVHLPDVRYSSRLLDLLPPQTAVYVSIPNLGPALGEVQQLIRQRVQDSPALRQWWEQRMESRKRGPNFDEVVRKLRSFSDYVGDEIVVAASVDPAGKLQDPVFLTEVRRPGLGEFLKVEAPELENSGLVQLQSDLLLIAPERSALKQVPGSRQARDAAGFARTPFGSRITQAYRDGAGLMFCVDLERITASRKKRAEPLEGMKYLLVEQKEAAGRMNTSAVLTFDGARKGVASWLAAPASMGALDFVSPDAALVSAFTIKDPAAILGELLTQNPKLGAELAKIETELGVNPLMDLAAPLGGEFAFALDGPALPTPSWKLAVEVYDPVRLQVVVGKLVEAVNRKAGGKLTIQLTEETAGARTYHSISAEGSKKLPEIHYLFIEGYLLAASSRASLDRAIEYREAGYTLARSDRFQSLVPQDGHTGFSGLVYQNLGPTIGPLVEGLSAGSALTSEQRSSMESVAAEMEPMLFTLYGEEDRITLATTGNLFGFGVSRLLGLPGTEFGGALRRGRPRAGQGSSPSR